MAYVVLYNIGGEKGLRYNYYSEKTSVALVIAKALNIKKKRILMEWAKITYGIKCDEVSVKDVSPNKEEVTELIDRLNQYGLSPCHLQDVIEDFIQE